MRTILLLSSIFLFSCTSYRYLKVDSENTKLNAEKDFTAETDSIKVVYRFSGWRLPTTVTVFNKTAAGLEVNWSQSAVIVNEQAYSFHDGKIQVSGDVRGSLHQAVGLSRPLDGSISATTNLPQAVQFIPPQSGVSRSGPFIALLEQALEEEARRSRGGSSKSWSKTASPVSFRVYLSVRSVDQGGAPISMERSFVVGEEMRSMKSPGQQFGKNQPGNVGFLQKVNVAAVGLGLVGGLLVAVAAF